MASTQIDEAAVPMSAQPARAQVVSGGYMSWETGIVDVESGLFAYRAWDRNRPVARVVNRTPSQHGHYIDLELI